MGLRMDVILEIGVPLLNKVEEKIVFGVDVPRECNQRSQHKGCITKNVSQNSKIGFSPNLYFYSIRTKCKGFHH